MCNLGVPRNQISITTKISPRESGYEQATAAINGSLTRLGLDYIDICLIHWPGTAKKKPEDRCQIEMRIQTWLALEKARNDGLVRSIGVSNFIPRHIESIISDHRTRIVPAVNQIELHPFCTQKETVEYCKGKGIAIQSYSTLGQGSSTLLEHPTILSVAAAMSKRLGSNHNIKASHICLRWAMQHGYGVIPRSSNPERIVDNFRVAQVGFMDDLTDEEMAEIDAISIREGERKFCWDPSNIC